MDRRRYERFLVSLEAELIIGSKRYKAEIENLSKYGACIITDPIKTPLEILPGAQIELEFKRAMPEARKMTNMKKRVERRLKDLNSGGKSSNKHQFLNLLSKASPALTLSDQFSIDTAVYKNNYIDFNITTTSLQSIESIKHKLDSIPGLKTVLSTSVEKKQVKARLRLESK